MVDVPFVVFGEIVALPGLLARPLLRGISPEGIGSEQAERHERQRSHVETTVIGVPVGHIGVIAHKSYREETIGIEVRFVSIVKHSFHHGSESSAHLTVCEFLRQFLLPGKHGEGLEYSQTVRYGTNEHGISAFGRDKTFQYDTEFLHTLECLVVTGVGTVETALCMAHPS